MVKITKKRNLVESILAKLSPKTPPTLPKTEVFKERILRSSSKVAAEMSFEVRNKVASKGIGKKKSSRVTNGSRYSKQTKMEMRSSASSKSNRRSQRVYAKVANKKVTEEKVDLVSGPVSAKLKRNVVKTSKGSFNKLNSNIGRHGTGTGSSSTEKIDPEEDNEETQYEVERILKYRVLKGKRWFLLKWKGYSVQESTWEPEHNLKTMDILHKFFDELELTKRVSGKHSKPTAKSIGSKRKLGVRSSGRLAKGLRSSRRLAKGPRKTYDGQ